MCFSRHCWIPFHIKNRFKWLHKKKVFLTFWTKFKSPTSLYYPPTLITPKSQDAQLKLPEFKIITLYYPPSTAIKIEKAKNSGLVALYIRNDWTHPPIPYARVRPLGTHPPIPLAYVLCTQPLKRRPVMKFMVCILYWWQQFLRKNQPLCISR